VLGVGVSLGLNLCKLNQLIQSEPAYRELLGRLAGQSQNQNEVLILDAAKPFLIASLFQNIKRPILVITAQPESAKRLYEQIIPWCNDVSLSLFPESDLLAYQRSIMDFSVEQERLQTLYLLSKKKSSQAVTITSIPAIIQKTLSANDFLSGCSEIRCGDVKSPLELMREWESLGYRVENLVDATGSISRRGDIVDIFPPTSDVPIRLEFFGNTIESIREFDSSSQRSLRVLTKLDICPASEVLIDSKKIDLKNISNLLDVANCNEETRNQISQDLIQISNGQKPPHLGFYSPLFNSGSLLDYVAENSLLILDDISQLQLEVTFMDEESSGLRKQKISAGELPANYPTPYFVWSQIEPRLAEKSAVNLHSWAGSDYKDFLRLSFIPAPSYAGQLSNFISKSSDLIKGQSRLILISNQASRLAELFEEADILSQPTTEFEEFPSPGSLTILQGSMEEGWVLNNTYLLTDKELFGFVKERRLLRRSPVRRHKLLVDIQPGDYVVHIEHGIGQFAGITNMKMGSTQKEYLVLSYAAGDKLYVPTEQIDRVNRYVGGGEQPPVLNRLGTAEWNRTKEKVQKEVEEIAEDLLELYAKREVVPGHAFAPDTVWQRELEASFPYVETPDQIKVQEEVKEDMSKARPMDRLVVGDVGYGKTEIAIRAAFKAVMDNKQVAVLVPTTVLAEQHYVTFKQRMGAFPIRIDVLSRFRSRKEQKIALEGLAKGNIDICIGTHRLLQKDVVFHDLGLIVIDEEQRFGVSHKEHLKKLREQVDVLTLSATPIPRTLHMSLVGVRDMSTIETPPENRLPIKTYVAEYNDQLVRESILREIERNGQIFFVHNRVQGIAAIADKLQKLVPEARIEIAHGQMPEDQLERVMLRFQKGETNLLVCTTIIESGLDLPNANTLIVNRADKFGLTQLYQLRGRIGRGSNLAYAYFLYDKEERLTATAEKRLRTIFESTELGAGFGIAMKDLEIRGAGTLLGMKQSGSISAVGFSLYTQLLAQAVEDQKARLADPNKTITREPKRPEPSVDLPLKAFFPENYIPEIDLRLSFYQRLTAVHKLEQVSDISTELIDRFGPLPPEAQNLLFVVRLKALGANMGVESIATNEDVITIRLFPGLTVNKQKLIPLYRFGLKIGLSQVSMNLKRSGKDWQKVLEDLIKSVL
jgi:transcription-repair coupling factor (superfamily II helicase)